MTRLTTRTGIAWLAALALGALAGLASAQPVSLGAIARNPMRFDRQTVTVTGTVGFLEGAPGRSPAGMPAQTFTLIDEGMTVRVTARTPPAVRPGDRVEVEGVFSFAGNQIEAFRVTPR